MDNVDILAFGAHPDDIELGCTGTLLKHIKLGYTVGLCDLTQGELGSRGNAKLRLQEAEDAKNCMGAKWRVNLGMKDGFFEHSYDNIMEVVKVIRAAKPKIVLANAPIDRHPDHGRGCKLVADACFYSGLVRIELFDQNGNKLEPHRPKSLFSYIQDKELKPDFVVDITDEIDQKIECVLKFSSQFFTDNDSEYGIQTPISGKQFLDFVRSKNAVYGRDIQANYAEGFITKRLHGISDLTLMD